VQIVLNGFSPGCLAALLDVVTEPGSERNYLASPFRWSLSGQ
jgi:hypothetical protein